MNPKERSPVGGPAAAPLRVEEIDREMVEVLAAKSGAERLEIAFGMFQSARRMLASHLVSEHPDWDDDRVAREVARRIARGSR